MTWRQGFWVSIVAAAAVVTQACTGFGTNCSTDADCQASNPQALCDATLKVCFVAPGPVVTKIQPANGTAGVAPGNAEVIATFSKPVVDAGVTFSSFTVIGQGFQTFGDYLVDTTSTNATFQPYGNSLALGTDYTVALTAAIKDFDGNALTPFTSSFSTKDGAWQAGLAAALRYNNNTNDDAAAMNYFGNVVTAISLGLGGGSSLHDFGITAGVSAPGGAPTTPSTANIQSTLGVFASFPSAGIAFDGTAFVAWSNSSSDAGAPVDYKTMAAVYDPGTGLWSAGIALEDAGAGVQNGQAVGLATGEGLFVWLHPESSGKQVVFGDYYVLGTGWIGAGSIQTDLTLNSSNLSLAGNPNGAALLTWQSEQATVDAGPPQIWGVYLPGSSIPPPVAISNTAQPAVTPYSALGIYGYGAVVWQTDTGSFEHIWASTVDPTKTPEFSAPVQVDSSAGSANFPQVGVAANGNAVAIWQEFTGSSNLSAVVSSEFDYATNRWSTPFVLDSSTTAFVYAPVIAVDPGGNALAAWFEGTEDTHQIFGGRYTPDAGWHDIMQLSTGNDVVSNYRMLLVVDAFGQGWVFDERMTATNQSYIEAIPFQ